LEREENLRRAPQARKKMCITTLIMALIKAHIKVLIYYGPYCLLKLRPNCLLDMDCETAQQIKGLTAERREGVVIRALPN